MHELLRILQRGPATAHYVWSLLDHKYDEEVVSGWLYSLEENRIVTQTLINQTFPPTWELTSVGEQLYTQNSAILQIMMSASSPCDLSTITERIDEGFADENIQLTRAGLLACLLRLEAEGYVVVDQSSGCWAPVMFVDVSR